MTLFPSENGGGCYALSLWSWECTSSVPWAPGVSPGLPPPSQIPGVSISPCVDMLQTKSLLVSGSALFCHRDLIQPEPSQVWSHSRTRGWKRSSSPAWHILGSPHVPAFPHRVQESYWVKIPGLDSLPAVISPPEHLWSSLWSISSAIAVWQNYSHWQCLLQTSRKQIHFSLINNFPHLSILMRLF